MNSKTEKIRTIGQAIDELVERYGKGSNGLYILEQSLKRAVGAGHADIVTIGGKLAHEFPAVRAIREEEARILAEVRGGGW